MGSIRLRAPDSRELLIALGASAATAFVILLASHRLGDIGGLLAPLALLLVCALLMRPVLAVGLAVVVPILCEGEDFGLLTAQAHVYDTFYKRLTPVDALVLLAALAVALDVLRDRRPLRFPKELRFLDAILALGMVAGIVVGKGAGNALKQLVLAENLIFYLLLLPIVVANLKIEPSRVRALLVGAFALALLKGGLGVLEILAHKGVSVPGDVNVTYLEPTANWVVVMGILGILAAVVARLRPPLWMLLGSPLLIASLVLSYRRSFWIATAIGILLVVMLALSPVGRRLLVPTALLIAAGIWLLGSINFQSNSPLAKRLTSLSPSSLTTNVEDRYRLDERANVFAELEKKPITGLGINVGWQAIKRPLSIEHEQAREYVHFAALWWWMKLGILGLISYVLMLGTLARLGWRVWRRSREGIVRAFGLASACGVAGLAAAETTATFTGSDLRFSVVIGVQIGLLALISSQLPSGSDPAAEEQGGTAGDGVDLTTPAAA